MPKTKLSDLLTIIIPCKNEEKYISNLLNSLRQQKIGDTKIIIADSSDDNTIKIIQSNKNFLNLEIIEGGTVAVARNNGAKLANTPYILFIDADVIFFDNYVIRDSLDEMIDNQLDLLTCKIRCYVDDWRAELSFNIFNYINSKLKYFCPFAIGAYMFTRKDKFDEYGGFPTNFVTSEDFFISRMYDASKFKILNHFFGQDNRRFKKMGYLGMSLYIIKNFINRNNKKYWENLSHSKYWN